MKLAFSFLVYLLIGWVIGYGILRAMHGSYWVLAFSSLFYVFLFARIGCMHP